MLNFLPMKMTFKGMLQPEAQSRVDECDIVLNDPKRLQALEKTQLMGSQREEAFDRLATLAARILKAPLTIISLVSENTQFFKAAYGLPAPIDELRSIPIDGSICRYTLKGQPIIANDASSDPLLKFHPATGPWKIGAFIAIPMKTSEGQVLGAFCAVHPQVHEWTQDEIKLMEDLTASVMTEIHLREQVMDLQVERELRNQFVMSLTHDLRTPLNAAKMSAQLIPRKTETDDISKLSGRIVVNMDRADKLITNLLDVSRIKVGDKISITPKPCHLNELVELTLEDLATLYGSRFEIVAENKSIHGVWDKSAIQRSIENLATNAVKYGSLHKPIKIHLTERDNGIEISVHNEGNPIAATELDFIFKPYHRTSSASQGIQIGWGMGLALVRGLIEAHGGSVRVESSQAAGTTFKILIPKDSSSFI